jgi:hypothetical protein
MMKIQQIVDQVTGREHADFLAKDGRKIFFQNMPLNAQVAIAYRCAQSAHNSVVWYSQTIEQEEARERPNTESIRASNRERIISTQALHSILSFISRAANYIEADGQTVGFDQADVNVENGQVENDEVVDEQNVAIKRAPHAWARDQLVAQGIWPEDFEATDTELVLFNLDRVANRMASQFIARMVISLYEDGIYIPQPSDARDLIILGLSPMVADLNRCKNKKSLQQEIMRLACLNPPYVNDRPYTRETIADYFNGLIEQDAEEAERLDTRNEIKEIRETVKEAIRTNAVMGAIISGAADMKKAGMSDDVIEKISAQLAAKLSN